MPNHPRPVFHHAMTVLDVAETRRFYGGLLGCPTARRGNRSDSVDFQFFGHHLVAHQVSEANLESHNAYVAAENARYRHFGLVMDWADWDALLERLRAKSIEFLVPPLVRHAQTPKEEALFMLRDPSGNALEFKTFRNPAILFGTDEGADG